MPGPPVSEQSIDLSGLANGTCQNLDFQAVLEDLEFVMLDGPGTEALVPCEKQSRCQISTYLRAKQGYGNYYISLGCGKLIFTEGGVQEFSDEAIDIFSSLQRRIGAG